MNLLRLLKVFKQIKGIILGRFVDCYEHDTSKRTLTLGEVMEHYIQYLSEFKAKHNVGFGQHLAPHDIEVRELSTGKTRKATAAKMGIAFRTVQRPRVKSEGHDAVRRIFPRLWLDENRAEHGVNCISSYQYEWDEKKGVFKSNPLHDWASHGADALQTLALGWHDTMVQGAVIQRATQAQVNVRVF